MSSPDATPPVPPHLRDLTAEELHFLEQQTALLALSLGIAPIPDNREALQKIRTALIFTYKQSVGITDWTPPDTAQNQDVPPAEGGGA